MFVADESYMEQANIFIHQNLKTKLHIWQLEMENVSHCLNLQKYT